MSVRLLSLGDICKPKQWATLAKKDMAQEGYPVYGANGVIGFASTFTHTAPVILVGCRGSCGSVHVTVPMAYANGNAMALDSLDSTVADITYVARFLTCRGFRDVTTGTSQPQIIRSNIVPIQIPLPPLPVQKRIAAILDAADALRAKRRESIEQLDSLVQATFLEMFGDPVTNPKGWKQSPLGDIMRIRRGGSPRPIDKYLGGTVNWVKISDATASDDDIYITTCAERITEAGLAKTTLLEPGSFIFANSGVSLGFARILKVRGAIHDGWLAFDQFSDDVLHPLFFLKALNGITSHFRQIAPSGTQPNLNTGLMKAFQMILPPLDLQTRFASIVESIEQQKARLKAHLAELDTLFASLQSRAFNGELVA